MGGLEVDAFVERQLAKRYYHVGRDSEARANPEGGGKEKGGGGGKKGTEAQPPSVS